MVALAIRVVTTPVVNVAHWVDANVNVIRDGDPLKEVKTLNVLLSIRVIRKRILTVKVTTLNAVMSVPEWPNACVNRDI